MKTLAFLIFAMMVATTAVAEAEDDTITILVTPLNGAIRSSNETNVIMKSTFISLEKKVWRKIVITDDPFNYFLFNRTNNSVVKKFTVIVQFSMVQMTGDFSLPGRSYVSLLSIEFNKIEDKQKVAPAAPALLKRKQLAATWASLKK